MPSNKEEYRLLCEEKGEEIPLFQQYWWMETVCEGKEWDVLLCRRREEIVGALPYLVGHKLWMRYILQPELTQFGGPWLAEGMSDEEQMRVMSEMVERLEAMHLTVYLQCFAPTVQNWLPFYWRGYSQTTRYTYRFDPLCRVEEHMASAMPERRKRLALIGRDYDIDRDVGIEEFVELHDEYYRRKSGKNLLSRQLIERVCRTAMGRGQGLIYGVRDKERRLMLADFVVYDRRSAYSLMSGMHEEAPRNGNSLLFWAIIGDLYGKTEAFDFEGSMDEGIGRFYRSFGAKQTAFYRVSRCRVPLLRYLLKI